MDGGKAIIFGRAFFPWPVVLLSSVESRVRAHGGIRFATNGGETMKREKLRIRVTLVGLTAALAQGRCRT